ncbi:hypothetical protein QYF61_025138 [Mycteria americana]|uniref:Uncharacterized protein n=1 Tax=Mycteria americana TaxID=33587 RepID=A0AAN7NFT4_MYCAM|nr:hypothetical protein QYF61_025138 [Mycteria americana]
MPGLAVLQYFGKYFMLPNHDFIQPLELTAAIHSPTKFLSAPRSKLTFPQRHGMPHSTASSIKSCWHLGALSCKLYASCDAVVCSTSPSWLSTDIIGEYTAPIACRSLCVSLTLNKR